MRPTTAIRIPLINAPLSPPFAPVEATPPRARGEVTITAKLRHRTSVIGDLRQAGSLKLLFPRPSDAALQGVLVNTAGGITGGDLFSLRASAAPGTTLTLSTQTAERAYRAQPGQTGQLRTRLKVAAGARLNWMPQETILFDGSALTRRLDITMAATARLLLCEPLIFGRAAMGETLTHAHFHDRIEITRDGAHLFKDALRLSGDIAAHMARPTIAAGAGALATLVYIAPDAVTHLDPVRAMIGPDAGASLLQPGTLVLRVLAPDGFALRAQLIPVLTRLSGGPLPRPWMI